jgi:hypothetical protein
MCVSSYQRSIFFSPKERKRELFFPYIYVYTSIHKRRFFRKEGEKRETNKRQIFTSLSILSSVCVLRAGDYYSPFVLCDTRKETSSNNEEGRKILIFFLEAASFEQRGNPPCGFYENT